MRLVSLSQILLFCHYLLSMMILKKLYLVIIVIYSFNYKSQENYEACNYPKFTNLFHKSLTILSHDFLRQLRSWLFSFGIEYTGNGDLCPYTRE